MGIQTSQITTGNNDDLNLNPNGTGEVTMPDLSGDGELAMSVDNTGAVKKLDEREFAELSAVDSGDLILVQRQNASTGASEYYSVDATLLGGAALADPDPSVPDIIWFPATPPGSGTIGDPFVLTPKTVPAAGGSTTSDETCQVINQDPDSVLIINEIGGNVGVRMDQKAQFCDNDGKTPVFGFNYYDIPASAVGQSYEGMIRLGTGSVYVKWVVNQLNSKTVFGPGDAPNASPLSVDYAGDSKYGIGTATWADGSRSLTSTGDLIFGVNGSSIDASAKSVSDGDTVSIGYVEAAVDSAAEGTVLGGDLISSDGLYTSTHTMTKDITPLPFAITPLADQELNGVATTGNLPLKGVNAPTIISLKSSTLTNVELSVGGAAFSSGPWTFNPGDSLQARGTTGGSADTVYNAIFTIHGDDYTWEVTTVDGTPTIEQPTIISPASGSGSIDPNATLVGDAYSPLDGAGAHAESDWEVYEIGCVPSEVEMYGLRGDTDRKTGMSRTPSVGSNVWTFSVWAKQTHEEPGSNPPGLFGAGTNNYDLISIEYSLKNITVIGTSGVYRQNFSNINLNKWAHVVVSYDGTDLKTSYNGETKTENAPGINFYFGGGESQHLFKGRSNLDYNYFDGYLSEAYYVDGQALDPETFGQELADGSWVPLAPATIDTNIGGTSGYGTNGFHLPFDPAAASSPSIVSFFEDPSDTGGSSSFSGGGNKTYDSTSKTFTLLTESNSYNSDLNRTRIWKATQAIDWVIDSTSARYVYVSSDGINWDNSLGYNGTWPLTVNAQYISLCEGGGSNPTTVDAGINFGYNSIGVDASGRDNHFKDSNFAVGNTDEVWSQTATLTGTPGYPPNGSITNLFDGDFNTGVSTYALPPGSTPVESDATITFASPISGSTVQLLINNSNSRNKIALNTNAEVALPDVSGYLWVQVPDTITQLSSITWKQETGGFSLRGIKIDGVEIVDANIQDTVTDTPVRDYAVLIQGTNGNLEGYYNATQKGEAGTNYYYELNGQGVVVAGPIPKPGAGVINFGQQPFAQRDSEPDGSVPETDEIVSVGTVSAWNQDKVWSAGFYPDIALDARYPATQGFDGDNTTFTTTGKNGIGGYLELNLTSANGPYDVEVHQISQEHALTINGIHGKRISINGDPSYRQWTGLTEVPRIVWPGKHDNGTDYGACGFYYVKVNGQFLVDSGVPGPAPQLPLLTFSGDKDLELIPVEAEVEQANSAASGTVNHIDINNYTMSLATSTGTWGPGNAGHTVLGPPVATLYRTRCGATSNNPPSADGQGTPDPSKYTLADSSLADTVNLESYAPDLGGSILIAGFREQTSGLAKTWNQSVATGTTSAALTHDQYYWVDFGAPSADLGLYRVKVDIVNSGNVDINTVTASFILAISNDPASMGDSICGASCTHTIVVSYTSETATSGYIDVDLTSLPVSGRYIGITNGIGGQPNTYTYSELTVTNKNYNGATYYSRVKYRDDTAAPNTVESLWSNWNEMST